MYEALGEMTIKDVVCPVYIPRYTSQVMVYLYPFEGDNQHVSKALSPFGTLQDIRHQEWSNVEGVPTGTRLVKVIRQHHIPRFNFIDGFKCKVWYKDQPLECEICHQGHKANVCPLRGKCLRCRQAGHFVAECPNPPWNHDDPAPAAASADASASAAPSSAGDTSSVVDPPSSIIVPDDSVNGASVSAAPPSSDAVASASVLSPVDLRDNQLDEFPPDSQPASQSVLGGLSVVSPSGDVLAGSADGLSQSDPRSAPVSHLQSSEVPSCGPS